MSDKDLKNQSLFRNVIHEPLLHIEPNKFCIPYLHILLGLVKKHHGLLEIACNDIDVAILLEKAKRKQSLECDYFLSINFWILVIVHAITNAPHVYYQPYRFERQVAKAIC